MRCVHIALLCVQENVAKRPTMNTIVLMLNSNSQSLPVPSEPAFLLRNSTGTDTSVYSNSNGIAKTDHSMSDHSAQASVNEASISDLYPR